MATEDQDVSSATSPSKSKRSRRGSWIRFSFRTLLLAVTLCCLVTWWFSSSYLQSERENQALEELRSAIVASYQSQKYKHRPQPTEELVKVKYDFQFDQNGEFDPTAKHWAPTWMQGELGDRSLARVVSLDLSTRYEYDSGDGIWLTDHAYCDFESLDFLLQFPNLRELTLDIGLKPDLDLSALGKLKQLRRLDFSSPNYRTTGGTFPLSAIENAKNLKELTITGLVVVASQRQPKCQLNELIYNRSGFRSPSPHQEGLQSFGDLSKLVQLKLHGCRKKFDLHTTSGLPSLKRVSLSGQFENLDGFSAAPIEELRLRSCSELKDVSAISGSTTLRKLEVYNYYRKSYFSSNSFRLPALEEAYLVNCTGGTVEFLKHSPRLKKLELRDRDITDLSPLDDLPDLKVLNTTPEFMKRLSW